MATAFRSVLVSTTLLVGFLSDAAAAAPPIEAFGRKRIRTLTELERFLWKYIGGVQPALIPASASATN